MLYRGQQTARHQPPCAVRARSGMILSVRCTSVPAQEQALGPALGLVLEPVLSSAERERAPVQEQALALALALAQHSRQAENTAVEAENTAVEAPALSTMARQARSRRQMGRNN